MSFEFRDNNNAILSSSSIKTLLSDLTNNGEVTLKIYTTEATTSPGIYLVPSTNLGEVDYPNLTSPYSDYSDLLLLGSNTSTTCGLKVTKVESGVPDEVVRFSFTNGAAYVNKILLPQLSNLTEGSTAEVKLEFEADDTIPTRRFYIGVSVDDS